MAGESSGPRHRRDQDRPLRSAIHPFVERLIGTIRREFLDQILFWNSVDLESKLLEFRDYYNSERIHSGIGGSTPCEAGGALTAQVVKLDNFRWQGRCRGLYQLPVAA